MYQNVDGGADGVVAGEVKVVKTDDSGVKLPGIKFKLQKEQTDGSFKDYILSTGEVEQSTDLSGELTFKKLDTGTYKIIETTQLSEYGSPKYSINRISDIDTFTIKSNDYSFR